MEHNPPPRIGFACKFNRRHPCELHTIPKRVLAARDGRRPRASTMALLMAPYISNVTLVPFESGYGSRSEALRNLSNFANFRLSTSPGARLNLTAATLFVSPLRTLFVSPSAAQKPATFYAPRAVPTPLWPDSDGAKRFSTPSNPRNHSNTTKNGHNQRITHYFVESSNPLRGQSFVISHCGLRTSRLDV